MCTYTSCRSHTHTRMCKLTLAWGPSLRFMQVTCFTRGTDTAMGTHMATGTHSHTHSHKDKQSLPEIPISQRGTGTQDGFRGRVNSPVEPERQPLLRPDETAGRGREGLDPATPLPESTAEPSHAQGLGRSPTPCSLPRSDPPPEAGGRAGRKPEARRTGDVGGHFTARAGLRRPQGPRHREWPGGGQCPSRR